MGKTVVMYRAECADGKWNVVKRTAKTDSWGGWHASDEKVLILAEDISQWNAKYIAACLEYLADRAKAPNVGGHKDAVFDVSSLDCLKSNIIDIDHLAYCYVRDTLGSGWAIHNGYKLTGRPLMEMWIMGSSCRFGFLPLDIDEKAVYEALSSAISKVLSMYGMNG